MRLLAQATDRKVELLVQLLQVAAHQVAHLHVLEVVPTRLRISRSRHTRLRISTLACAAAQPIPPRLRAEDGGRARSAAC
jgi:hypothetical protein